MAPILTEEGEPSGVVIVIRDETAEFRLQHQLQHSQKMDVIGQLAGGIAHDFNNMLGGIIGISQLLSGYTKEAKAAELNQMILSAALRSADLTKKLLTFLVRPI